MQTLSNKSTKFIILFFIFIILVLIEGFICKYTKLGFCNQFFFSNFWKENGFIESIQCFLLLFAIIFIIKSRNIYKHNKFINTFLIIKTIALIYYLGEEISWGQHFFKWDTPIFFKDINIQKETNIHNISNLFDQLPRTLVIIWCGLIVPVILKLNKKYKIDSNLFKILCPDEKLKYLSLMLLIFFIPDFIVDRLGLHPGHVDAFGQGIEASIYFDIFTFNYLRLSELHELIFTFYFFIYSIEIMKKKN
tara:strand:- start:1165 stop:1911 length:747 start_codon:yes stop_codon:yes gene_type:complete